MDDLEKLKVVIRANSQVAVFGSGVSRVYRRIVRYTFHIGPRFAFFPLRTDLFFFFFFFFFFFGFFFFFSFFLGDII
jgi:hypothetical protein